MSRSSRMLSRSGNAHRRVLVRVAVVGTVVGAVLVVAWRAGLFALEDREQLAAAIERVRALPYLVPVFIATYAIAAAAGVPATPLTLAGGILFGATWGIALNWTGEMAAALLAFAAARSTGLRARPLADAGDTARTLAGGRSARTLFRLRLIPVVPFALLNAGAAVSGMTWRDFALATAVGILPLTVIYTVSASELVAGVEGSGARAMTLALASAAVLIGLSFLPVLVRVLSRSKP